MLAESYVLKLIFAGGLSNPTSNVVIGRPPAKLGKKKTVGSAGVNRAIVGAFFPLYTLLMGLGRRGTTVLGTSTCLVIVLSIGIVTVLIIRVTGLVIGAICYSDGRVALVGLSIHILWFRLAFLAGIAVDINVEVVLGHCGKERSCLRDVCRLDGGDGGRDVVGVLCQKKMYSE